MEQRFRAAVLVDGAGVGDDERTLKPAGAGLDRECGFEFPLDRRHVFELIEQGTGGVDGAPVRPGCAVATVDEPQEPVEAAEHATHLQEFDGVAQVRIVDLDEIFRLRCEIRDDVPSECRPDGLSAKRVS